MDIRFQQAPAADWRANTAIVFGFKDENLMEQIPALADAAPWITITPARHDFRGEKNQTVVMYGHPEIPLPRCIAVGLGERTKFNLDTLRGAMATAMQKCRELKVDTCALDLEVLKMIDESDAVLVEESVAAALLSLYTYDELKTTQDEPAHNPRWMALLSNEENFPDDLHAAARRGEAAAIGVMATRNLVNGPANIVTPAYLVEKAEAMGRKYGFKVRSINGPELAEMGMGAFESVFKGAEEQAKLLIMEYTPKGTENDDPIVFVGKGVTFDTGGISLKPSASMHEMKSDMAGAAAVIGLFEALGNSDIQRRVVGVAPCTENMPDGRATRPGDVVKTLSGKTVEIINTDAEGRLILCDALTWVQKEYTPAAIFDLATLTGACVVALGTEVAAVFATDEALSKQVQDLGGRVGDRFWPMPLWDLYFEPLKSEVADMMNVGGREGGAVNAALFLKQFINEDVRWAHLDIAGPAYKAKKSPLSVPGSTGFAVRTLLEIVRNGVAEKPE
ncbi:leucyl aminopeptidase [Desulfovibrio mangrovi]|uniref:leucyl aminopeptidase n=1 Tax=Desulfovibrio mangrovi TaxID=2976983 RepID=UPI002246284C|nr:leucyl aminopeptidase [Desulfovibrio mangrovi]UZP66240.1 leucyl aminopeptidase [Desulfovibrio mangrovi]